MTVAKVDASKTISSLRLLNAAIHNAAQMALRDAVVETEKNAAATTLWKNQRPLTRSTIHGTVGIGRGEVRAGGASHFLEWGTNPHVIEGRNGGMLHFWSNGVEFFRRRVHHPGTRERPFMRTAREHGALVARYAADFYVTYAIEHIR